MQNKGDINILDFNELSTINCYVQSIAKLCKDKVVLTIGCVDMIDVIHQYNTNISSESFQLYNLNKCCKEVVGLDK
ncbi:MAG: hypothetical protein ATN32_04565 [Candidatus Epulonipiscium fishelsonii]|nr:MAG: hypothetical protein ATN32_04565 [Epulopiscium sp. AS2M-Bin002]